MIEDRFLRTVFMVSGIFLVGLIISILGVYIWHVKHGDDVTIGGGARIAFEAYLMALDDQEWALANSYVKEECQAQQVDAAAASRNLDSRGYSFQRAFVVDTVWFNENGIKVWLVLEDRPTIMRAGTAALMELVGGEWLISCG